MKSDKQKLVDACFDIAKTTTTFKDFDNMSRDELNKWVENLLEEQYGFKVKNGKLEE